MSFAIRFVIRCKIDRRASTTRSLLTSCVRPSYEWLDAICRDTLSFYPLKAVKTVQNGFVDTEDALLPLIDCSSTLVRLLCTTLKYVQIDPGPFLFVLK